MIALNGEVIRHRKALGPIPSAEENIFILKYGDVGVAAYKPCSQRAEAGDLQSLRKAEVPCETLTLPCKAEVPCETLAQWVCLFVCF